MKNIWIFNHYAGPPSIATGLRHFYFAKYLIQAGYKVTIFNSSAQHNSDINLITDDKHYIKYKEENVPFVYIKTRQYKGNGKKRILNMIDYYLGLLRITKKFKKPDLIIGSSVHPLACLAAIKLSKKYKCKNIIEIRDLWPETLVSLGKLKKNFCITNFLYKCEKWLYKKADKVLFTMEGGIDYIKEKKWDKEILLKKIHYINNGVDLAKYEQYKKEFVLIDPDLNNENIFRVIYAGSIRKANNLKLLIDAAQILKQYKNIKILIFGEGNDKENLEKYCKKNSIDNVCFKNAVEKKYIPFILSKSNLNILNYIEADIFRFGTSQNKLFDYLASGKPICSNLTHKYCLINKNNCGIAKEFKNTQEYAEAILYFYKLTPKKYLELCCNATLTVKKYDFKRLTKDLIKIIEEE